MSEAKWNAYTDPEVMLSDLYGRATPRKLRLFGVACVRRIWNLVTDERSRQVVLVAERYADGMASDDELAAAAILAASISEDYYPLNWSEIAINAADAALSTVMDGSDGIFTYAYPITVCATKAVDSSPGAGDVERAAQATLVREIFGNPFRPVTLNPSWHTSTSTSLAQSIYTDRTFDRMPILADALEDTGCTNQDILAHCRNSGSHVRGCWVVDLLLGKS